MLYLLILIILSLVGIPVIAEELFGYPLTILLFLLCLLFRGKPKNNPSN